MVTFWLISTSETWHPCPIGSPFVAGVEGMLGGGLVIYVCCMVATMDSKKFLL